MSANNLERDLWSRCHADARTTVPLTIECTDSPYAGYLLLGWTDCWPHPESGTFVSIQFIDQVNGLDLTVCPSTVTWGFGGRTIQRQPDACQGRWYNRCLRLTQNTQAEVCQQDTKDHPGYSPPGHLCNERAQRIRKQ